ncbi:MAG: hypothetical protein FJY56_03765 [Betaproteobacteria bacterium]|nr:hypothetical protein [Betaproteobacteria bacterium]
MRDQQQIQLDVFEQKYPPKEPLSEDEKEGIVLAVKSAFLKLKNLYDKITPVFDEYGFKAPSAGVVARDLSEKIETSIIQHCRTFTRGLRHADLARFNKRWEVKICKDSGLTINQSAVISGENYIVVNYKNNSRVKKIWILWEAKDEFFSARRRNSNARTVDRSQSQAHIETIYEAEG